MKIFGGAKKQKGGYLRGLNTSSILLENRYILYVFFVMTIVNLVYFIGINDMKSTVVLILSGFVTSFFSKNMIVILCFALVVSNLFKYGINPRNIEGFDTEESVDDEDEDGKKKVKEGVTGESNVEESEEEPKDDSKDSKDSTDGSGNSVSATETKLITNKPKPINNDSKK